jgi:hypothetical protein
MGCILVGESFALIGGTAGIALSKDGFAEFLNKEQGESFTLDVVSVP